MTHTAALAAVLLAAATPVLAQSLGGELGIEYNAPLDGDDFGGTVYTGGLEYNFAQPVSISVNAEDIGFPDRRQARHLFRITQEALSNAVRHAQADTIRITLHQTPQSVLLEVYDNGVGFDPGALGDSEVTEAGGRGLASMRHRATLMNGSLQIRRADSGGTLVRVRVPQSESFEAD